MAWVCGRSVQVARAQDETYAAAIQQDRRTTLVVNQTIQAVALVAAACDLLERRR